MLKLSEAQLADVEKAGVSVEALEVFWRLFPDQNLDVAIGGVETLLKGEGQLRNARFSNEPPVLSEDFKAASEMAE